MKTIIALAALIVCSGCVVQTTYTKTVSVKKNSEGKIIETVETEGIVQPCQNGYPVKFQYLDGIQPKPLIGSPQ